MRYLVYKTDNCIDTAKKHGLYKEINKNASKIEEDQSVSSWESSYPDPIIKKNVRNFRLIASKKNINENIIICFLDLISRGSIAYTKFMEEPGRIIQKLEPKDFDLEHFLIKKLESENQLPLLRKPNPSEYSYLFKSGLENIDEAHGIIFESTDWVNDLDDQKIGLLSRYYDLLTNKILSPKENGNIVADIQNNVKILFRKFISKNIIFLIGALSSKDSEIKENRLLKKYENIINIKEEDFNVEKILRYSGRSYPALILADEEQVWHDIQKNSEGNLALSPEESEILKNITKLETSENKFPLFINGRPGSGKSTILQYIFAEYLFLHLSKNEDERLEDPPIYLTYSGGLIDVAKKAVSTIIQCNAKLVTSKKIDLKSSVNKEIFDRSFGEYHKFILKFLPKTLRNNFLTGKFIDYTGFRNELNKNHDLRKKISPELAWSVIRTYIKGMSYESNEYFNEELYKDLPEDQKTVSNETFLSIYKNVWQNWYKPLCEKEHYWDDQDLTRKVLDNNDIRNLSKYPAIFCDEAQDFTQNELELILNLNLFSSISIDSIEVKQVPFAFAGDPFQTLNPTGFNWNSVKANFHNKILANLDKTNNSKIEMNYKELNYNYRSTDPIVGFINLIQLLRGLLFGIKGLKPQIPWFEKDLKNSTDKYLLPQYFNISNEKFLNIVKEEKDLVIILPCLEGEEQDYVSNDKFLSSLIDKSHFSRNFLSSIKAKGLEFNRVLLYKFGDEIVNNFQKLFEPLLKDENLFHEGEEALPFEYFINRLFVAASRAKKNLLILDTEQGIKELWDNNNLLKYELLVKKYNQINRNENCSWEPKNLSLIEPGRESSFKEGKEDPRINAEAFKRAGVLEKDSYKLNLAANSFRRADMEKEALNCEAIAYKYDENLKKAGEIFSRIDKTEEALECFWRIEAFENIVNNSIFNNTIYKEAAIFMVQIKNSKPTLKICKTILGKIIQSFKDNENIFLGEYFDTWKKVFSSLLSTFSNLFQKNNDDLSNWKQIYNNLDYLIEKEIITEDNNDFAALAFKAEDYKRAINIWDKLSVTKHYGYYYSKGKTNEFPDNLMWFFKADKVDEVVEVLNNIDINNEENSRIFREKNFPTKYIDKILENYLKNKNFNNIYRLIKLNGNYELIEKYYNQIKDYEKNDIIKDFFNLMIEKAADENRWEDILEKYEKKHISEDIEDYANSILVEKLAFSDNFLNITNNKKEKFSKYLRETFIENAWKDIYDIKIVGTAIEKANKIVDALDFYESIWREKKIPASPKEIEFAKERWLKRKELLAINAGTAGYREQKHRSEIENKMHEWGLTININNLSNYPIIEREKNINREEDNRNKGIPEQKTHQAESNDELKRENKEVKREIEEVKRENKEVKREIEEVKRENKELLDKLNKIEEFLRNSNNLKY